MIDYNLSFNNHIIKITPLLNSYGYYILNEAPPKDGHKQNIKLHNYIFWNPDLLIKLNINITCFENQNYIISFNLFNKNENESKLKWRAFSLFDYIDDNNLQDKFIYKTQGDENVEAFIDQYFKNLEYALKDYLKPYVTGEKYIDHYVRMMDDYYAQTSALQMQQEIINQHLAKQGKMAILRQMVIGFKQDVRNYMDKVKNFFLPPNLR